MVMETANELSFIYGSEEGHVYIANAVSWATIAGAISFVSQGTEYRDFPPPKSYLNQTRNSQVDNGYKQHYYQILGYVAAADDINIQSHNPPLRNTLNVLNGFGRFSFNF
ncbi:hypothetical protein WN944_008085 [Citrus x changshan-huyou]|uniref:Uncharacterized protein n=1 Tax=Citrus x changshan-huyou TaxID=2935761 RepID=A0AAP0MM91_9ROSI